jgi:hypothetical protein
MMVACSLEGLVRWLNKDYKQHDESIASSGLAFTLIDHTLIGVIFNSS